jgi:hypothetical protein
MSNFYQNCLLNKVLHAVVHGLVFLVNTGTEPKEPILNTFGTDSFEGLASTKFFRNRISRVPRNRTDRFGITERPGDCRLIIGSGKAEIETLSRSQGSEVE